jgi:hypothetical protein
MVRFLFRVEMGLVLALVCMSANAAEKIILSAPPATKRVEVPPQGYYQCYYVPSAYAGETWINRHRVCEYKNPIKNFFWIEGYWKCSVYSKVGICSKWNWVPSHWANPNQNEYGTVPLLPAPRTKKGAKTNEADSVSQDGYENDKSKGMGKSKVEEYLEKYQTHNSGSSPGRVIAEPTSAVIKPP